jgi:hypothetical protein
MAVVWDVAPCSLIETERCSKLIVLMMEPVSTSETSGNFYHTTRRNIPQDSHLQNLTIFGTDRNLKHGTEGASTRSSKDEFVEYFDFVWKTCDGRPKNVPWNLPKDKQTVAPFSIQTYTADCNIGNITSVRQAWLGLISVPIETTAHQIKPPPPREDPLLTLLQAHSVYVIGPR